MTYPSTPQFLRWWKLGSQRRQPDQQPGAPGYDPESDTIFDDMAIDTREET